MRKRLVFLVISLLWLLPLLSAQDLAGSEKEKLTEIVNELESLTTEQEQIISSLQTKNEKLENSLKNQEQNLNELTNLSEDKQTIINEQRKIIDEQKSLLEKPRTSWIITLINSIVAVVAAFFGGFFVGHIFM